VGIFKINVVLWVSLGYIILVRFSTWAREALWWTLCNSMWEQSNVIPFHFTPQQRLWWNSSKTICSFSPFTTARALAFWSTFPASQKPRGSLHC